MIHALLMGSRVKDLHSDQITFPTGSSAGLRILDCIPCSRATSPQNRSVLGMALNRDNEILSKYSIFTT